MHTATLIVQIFGGVLGIGLVAYFTPSTYRAWKAGQRTR